MPTTRASRGRVACESRSPWQPAGSPHPNPEPNPNLHPDPKRLQAAEEKAAAAASGSKYQTPKPKARFIRDDKARSVTEAELRGSDMVGDGGD